MARALQEIGACEAVTAVALDDDPGKLVKTGPTLFTGYEMHNTTAADAFVKLYDAAALADVTLGTTTVKHIIPIGANAIKEKSLRTPIHFQNGVVAFSVTAAADSGSTGAAVDCSFEVA